jgi:hypothetical protein
MSLEKPIDPKGCLFGPDPFRVEQENHPTSKKGGGSDLPHPRLEVRLPVVGLPVGLAAPDVPRTVQS